MSRVVGFNGDEAIAFAAKQCNVDVVAAYPITPQTIIVEHFSRYVADGEVDTELICVESEHSAMSACIGASLTGARVFTATASQGLALMHEMLYIASGMRCPIVMGVANRALSAPINIHGDHSDMMGSRDCGWIQIYCENVQEAYDWTIQAFKIAEKKEVLLPVSVNIDGFIVSHSMEGANVMEDKDVTSLLPPREALYTLDPTKPMTFGSLFLFDYYFEAKRQQEEATAKASEVIAETGREYENVSGRRYGVLDVYAVDDAEVAILCLGSTAGTARAVARKLRARGKKVGVIKLWLYRPFPKDQIARITRGLKAVAVLDRAISFGAPYGALCSDLMGTLYGQGDVKVLDAVYGLGGRDITPSHLELVFEKALEASKTGVVKEPELYLGVRD